MRTLRQPLLLFFLLMSQVCIRAFEPVTTTVAGVLLTSAIYPFGYKIYNFFHENCNDDWLTFNSTGLEADLEKKLFGQHVASKVILKAVTGFMENKNPKKPLVLSLHGWTGTGKNFISHLIAKNIYRNGMKSSFVHQFVATNHFPHPGEVQTYKAQLQQWIRGNVTSCPRSMFIFDEMDKMHPGLIDSIKPFLDYYEHLDGVSYHQAIFIFLSNAGGGKINEVALRFWDEGKERTDIQLKDLEISLSLDVFNNKNSGFWHTSLIDKNLVDFFIPLLPLEHKHVRMCVLAEMKERDLKPDETIANEIANEINYFPKEKEIFSVKGCKTIGGKLSYYT
ncbi:torsin-1A isoform X2 [Amia ocellicauda]|uniref:torsin-1A isoform X2 n=1 Tax=Amia ocellicauda TaxID=2972642 RepID=UPI003463BDFA